MKPKRVRNALGAGILSFLFVSISSLLVAGFGMHQLGKSLAGELVSQMNERMEELTFSFSRMAITGKQKNDMVNLSSTMMDLVEKSIAKSERLQAEEAIFINTRGELLAHNDVTYLAKSSEKSFNDPRYTSAMARPKRDPVEIAALDTVPEPEGILEGLVYRLLKKMHPNLLASRFQAGAAVYFPDAILPTGAVHILFRNKMQEGTFVSIVRSVRETIRAGILIGLGVMIPMGWIVYLMTPGQQTILHTHREFESHGESLEPKPENASLPSPLDVVAEPANSEGGEFEVHDFSEKLSPDSLAEMLDDEMPDDHREFVAKDEIEDDDDDFSSEILIFPAKRGQGAFRDSSHETARSREHFYEKRELVQKRPGEVVPLRKVSGMPVQGKIVDAIPLNRN